MTTCKCCEKQFSPSKNDPRIVFCSDLCRLKYRELTKYTTKWVHNNKEHAATYRESRKDVKNAARREKYKNDDAYRESIKLKVKNYSRRNPSVKKNQHLLESFGITYDDYNLMLEQQNGKCAICGREDSGDKQSNHLYVDHCHKTGIIRGLLCSQCNMGLGKFYDSPDLLIKAAEYVKKERHDARKVDSMVRPKRRTSGT